MSAQHLLAIWRGIPGCPVPDGHSRVIVFPGAEPGPLPETALPRVPGDRYKGGQQSVAVPGVYAPFRKSWTRPSPLENVGDSTPVIVFTPRPPTKPGIYVWQSQTDSVEHLAEVNLRNGTLVMRMLVSETDWMPVSEIRDCFWAHIADITLNSEP